MNEKECKVFFARNIQELFYQIKTIQGLQVIGAGTSLPHLPEKSLSTTIIPDLRQIIKHERYLEVGPGVTIAELLNLGERHLPQVLFDAAKTIANPFIRNLATIGGNICSFPQRLTLYAPLLALDAQLEIKSQSESKFISIASFSQIDKNALLTNIRIPLSEWDVSIFQRLGPEHAVTEESAGFAFLVDSEKRIISNIRIAFAGAVTFRSMSLENKLLGLRLPLNFNEIPNYLQEAELSFEQACRNEVFPPILKQQFINMVRYSLEQLT